MDTDKIMEQISPDIRKAINEHKVVKVEINVNQYSKIVDVSVTSRKRLTTDKNCPYHQG